MTEESIHSSQPTNSISGWWFPFIFVIITSFAGLLLWRLWHIQILENGLYSTAQRSQSYRRVQLPGMRGRIFDRNGLCLADNRPSHCIVLYAEELRKPGKWSNTISAVNDRIDELATFLDIPRQVSTDDTAKHIYRSLPMPFIIWRDIDFKTLSRLNEYANDFPEFEVITLAERTYPHKETAAHLIGYVGREQPTKPDDKKWHYYLPEMRGRSGLESYYDRLLSGQTGEEIIRVDARGYRHKKWIKTPAKQGHDLQLTIDALLQQDFEAQFVGKSGAGIILNPKTGDLLALVSAPGYDLNRLVPRISSQVWHSLNNDPNKPMFNRAIQGQYPPGSVFKPITAIAALQNGYDTSWEHTCTGVYRGFGLKLRCWLRWGHGALDMQHALMHSCNPYFCALTTDMGYQALYETARQAGLGQRTGLDLPFETSGLLPSPAWKKRRFKQSWTPADTAQAAIGQSFTLTSPIQVANAIATLANRGKVIKPRLVISGSSRGELVRDCQWDQDAVEAVIQGMIMVTEQGTGRRMRIKGVSVASKTGSAEYMDGKTRRKQTWSVAFAPADNPEVLVVVLVENGISGGVTAGPLVQHAMAKYFKTTTPDQDEILDEWLGD